MSALEIVTVSGFVYVCVALIACMPGLHRYDYARTAEDRVDAYRLLAAGILWPITAVVFCGLGVRRVALDVRTVRHATRKRDEAADDARA